MQPIFRRTLPAAMVLIASLGATLVAAPAAAQQWGGYVQHQAVPAPFIDRFVLRGAGSLEPGSQVLFRLVGAAGGQAWLEVPGVLRPSLMQETRPGVYETVYVIRWRDTPQAFSQAVATLQSGGQQASARVVVRDGAEGRGYGWAQPAPRDHQGPQITDLVPSQGDLVGRRWTRISARLTDDASGVDTATATLRIDGRDVTARSRIEGDQLLYAEILPPGRHVAEVVVRDRAGNASRRAWAFEVQAREDRYGFQGHPGQTGYYAQQR